MPEDLGSYHVPDEPPRKVAPVDFLNRLKETEARHQESRHQQQEEAGHQAEHDAKVQAAAARQAQEKAAAAKAEHEEPRPEPASSGKGSGFSSKQALLVILGGLLLGLALIVAYERFGRTSPAPAVVPAAAPSATPTVPATSVQIVPTTSPDAASNEGTGRGTPPGLE